jgi:hypothetical protein
MPEAEGIDSHGLPKVVSMDLLLKALQPVQKQEGLVRTRQRTFTYAELHERKDEQQQFLIPDMLPMQAVTVFIGEDGIGKTQIMSQLAAHIALGYENWLTLPLNAKHKAALIVATEDSRQKFTQAITRIMYTLEPSHKPETINIRFTEGSDFDDFTDLGNEMEDSLKAQETDLVVVDALSDVFTLIDGDINSNSHARKILNFFQYLCNTYGCAMVIIHHASKTKIVEMRKENKVFISKNFSQGAGAITQKPRTVLALSSDPTSGSEDSETYTNYLHVVKANLMGKYWQQNALQLAFNTSTLTHKVQGKVNVELTGTELAAADSADNKTKRKPEPQELPMAQHIQILVRVFSGKQILTRAEIIDRMQSQYGVGKLKIEQSGGYLQWTQLHKLVLKTPDGFILQLPANYNAVGDDGKDVF